MLLKIGRIVGVTGGIIGVILIPMITHGYLFAQTFAMIGDAFSRLGNLFLGVPEQEKMSESNIKQQLILLLAAFLFSVLGIVGSIIAKNRPKLGSTFIYLAAIGGFVCTLENYFLVPGILLLMAGTMILVDLADPESKKRTETNTKVDVTDQKDKKV
ncbi:hypothetical protein [Pseudalkalibacillus decolorationis]|uniref:hypothetical protein n=1 Tax=Pseudalkalibacillus decolorationis TaxID=163879 RepID=UPI0021475744|nr:hypothetical protein [Pseudalkalibacillus decolorationis]